MNRGQSSYNSSIIGWAGHTINGPSENVTEMLEKAMTKYEIEEIVREVKFFTMYNEDIPVSAKDDIVLKRINYPGNCYTLDVTQIYNVSGKGIRKMFMRFGDISSMSVKVSVLGKSLDSRKSIRSNSFYSKGVSIRPENQTWSSYIVKTQEVIYVEEDKSKDCKDYPNSEFQSFGDCEDQGSKDFLAKKFPNIIPVWLMDNIENVTTGAVIPDGNFISVV